MKKTEIKDLEALASEQNVKLTHRFWEIKLKGSKGRKIYVNKIRAYETK